MGWVPPMGSHSDALTHVANGQIVICARKEEKILPSPVIKQALEAKIAKLEAEQARKLKKTEKDSLKAGYQTHSASLLRPLHWRNRR